MQSIPVDGGTIPGNCWPEVVRDISHNERQRMTGLAGVHGRAIHGLPGDTLANLSNEVDLPVIGSRGYGPLGRLDHGSTRNHPVRKARRPLLTLPRAAKADGRSPRHADADRVETAGVRS